MIELLWALWTWTYHDAPKPVAYFKDLAECEHMQKLVDPMSTSGSARCIQARYVVTPRKD